MKDYTRITEGLFNFKKDNWIYIKIVLFRLHEQCKQHIQTFQKASYTDSFFFAEGHNRTFPLKLIWCVSYNLCITTDNNFP